MTVWTKKYVLALCLGCLPCTSSAQKSAEPVKQAELKTNNALRAAYTTYVQAVQSGRLGLMPTSQRLLLLSVSLSPQQWKAIGSSKGLGLQEVSAEQTPLFLSLVPEPFHTRASVLKQGARHVFGPVTTLSPQERLGVRLRLDRAVEVTLLEEASPTTGRVFRNWGPEAEEARITQEYASAPVKDEEPAPALTGEQERLLHKRMAAQGRAFVHYTREDTFAPAPWLDARLEAAWQQAPGPMTLDMPVSDLSVEQQARIGERVAAWNEANVDLRLLEYRIRMRMEFRLFYLLPNGSSVLTPGT